MKYERKITTSTGNLTKVTPRKLVPNKSAEQNESNDPVADESPQNDPSLKPDLEIHSGMEDSDPKRSPDSHVFTPKQLNMLQQVSEAMPSKLSQFKAAYVGMSRKAAINAKCLECVSGDTKAIRECTATSCPLWNTRPYQEARS